MESNYSLYIKEREGLEILEDEKGFATYRELPAKQAVYIQDIFVRREFRKEGIAKAYADRIVFQAKLKGYTTLIGSIDPKTNGAKASKQILEAYGMQLKFKGPDGLFYFTKEII